MPNIIRFGGGTKYNSGGGNDSNTVLLLHAEDYSDASAQANTVTNSGTSIDSNGKFGSCFNIGWSDQYVNVAYNSALQLGDYATIDFWMYRSAAQDQGSSTHVSIFSNLDGNTGYQVGLNQDYLKLYYGTGLGYSAVNLMAYLQIDSKWHHYAITKNGTVFKMYYDGVLLTTNTLSDNFSNGTGNFIIGKSYTEGYSLNGKIDELRVSNVIRWTENFTPPISKY